jgi:Ni,Fe-hydrogenase III small subunit/formate hydrogenlyase subunit 6/NADH:ubiquinone oxidoreductase subunit I
MFDILRQSLKTGVVTTHYPETAPEVSNRSRGKPEIDWANWQDARPAAAICPTGAISYEDAKSRRAACLDLAQCIFCGLCEEVDKAIRMTNVCESAANRRADLVSTAEYSLKADGTHERLLSYPTSSTTSSRDASTPRGEPDSARSLSPSDGERAGVRGNRLVVPDPVPSTQTPSIERLGQQIQSRAQHLFGRSLHIREVDAGSCNGCEIEIVGLNSPIYDLERFGIHFVASPRHADMLLVTGPVTRNMELALKKTYDATPEPRLVVAVGACGCSGGIFGRNYATCGAVDAVIPVDVYIPGCPPNPHALLHGILTAIGRIPRKG